MAPLRELAALSQPRRQPAAVRGEGLECGGPHSLHRAACLRRPADVGGLAESVVHLFRHQADGPVELGDRGLQVHLRHPAERGPGGGQGLRDRREPPGEGAEPVGQGRVVPGEQRVDRLARVGEQRVPRVLAQFLDLKQAARHVVA